MLTKKYFRNPIDLRWLKSEFSCKDLSESLILRDDVWKKNLLILRGGKYLTESVVDKLLNFGVKEINISLEESAETEDQEEILAIEDLKGNYIKNQNILILDRKFKFISYLAKIMMDIGFKDRNIYASTDLYLVNKYIKTKNPLYLFIEYEMDSEKTLEIINNLESNKDIHIFLIVSEENKEIIPDLDYYLKHIDLRIMAKPIAVSHFKQLVSQCIDRDFRKLLKNTKPEATIEIVIGA